MNAALADALQDCLEHLEAGEPMHAALARHAALSAELRPLVFAALLVRQHRPVPAPGFRARVQVALANADLDAAAEAAPTQRIPAPGRAPWRPFAARLSGALLAVVMLTGGVVVASANSRPGDMLYPVRRGVEQVQEAAVHALVPVITGVHAPRGSLAADPTPATNGSTAAPRAGGAGSPARGDAPTDRSGQSEVADDAAQPDNRGTDRNRGRPQRGASSDNAAPAADASAAGAAQTIPTAAPTLTEPPEAVAMAQEATHTPAAAERQPSRPEPAQPPDTRATPVTQAPEPTVEPAGVKLITLPEMPRSGDSKRGGVAGVVAREDGTPLRNAKVTLFPLTSSGEISRYGYGRRETRTDDDGRYEFERLYPGRYKASAAYGYHRGGAEWRWYPATQDLDQAEVITVTAGFVRDAIDFRFPRLPLLEVGPIPFPWPWLAPQRAP